MRGIIYEIILRGRSGPARVAGKEEGFAMCFSDILTAHLGIYSAHHTSGKSDAVLIVQYLQSEAKAIVETGGGSMASGVSFPRKREEGMDSQIRHSLFMKIGWV